MKDKISLLLVDDHILFRQSLASLIETSSDFKIIGQAENGLETLELLKKLEPDVILLDIEMPVMDGQEATIKIKKDFPWIKIIIISSHDENYFTLNLLKAGADGFLSKGSSLEELISAIELVNSGGTYFDEEISKMYKDEIEVICEGKFALNQLLLNATERKIIKQITTGKTGNEIAEHLNMSISNYNNHKKSIRSKTGCKTDAEIVFYAIKQGIIPRS